MKYTDALKYIFDHLPMFQREGKSAFKKDLTNILALCQALGHPERNLPCIHIAGTNGKGSVTHLIAAMLQAHGKRTGLYTSPHYRDFRERIKVNGKMVDKLYLSRFIEKNMSALDSIKPSFFEMGFALALDWFRHEKVDLAAIETGLGGRLDSTNIVSPVLSVITNISWDHTDMLGDSLEKIATEKAGIIKKNAAVLIGRRQDETAEVFSQKSRETGSALYYTDEISETNQFFDPYGKPLFQPALQGPYQLENYRTALAAFFLYCRITGMNPDRDRIRYALEHTASLTGILGRWHFTKGVYDLLLDSAHNEDGIRFLTNWINEQKYLRIHFICGFVKDKSLAKILNLLPRNAIYYFTQASIPRALDSGELQKQGRQAGLEGKAYKKVRNALAAAKKQAAKGDLVVVAGSIFVVAEVI